MEHRNGVNVTIYIKHAPWEKPKVNFGDGALSSQVAIKVANVSTLIISFCLAYPEARPYNPHYRHIEVRCGCSRLRNINLKGFQLGATRFECHPLRHQLDTDMPVPFSRCEFRLRTPQANGYTRSTRWIALPEGHSMINPITIEGTVTEVYACTLADCTVCFKPYFGDHLKLKCNHCFHRRCLLRWFKEALTCPNCRAPL